jgi:hypothetical protein
MKRSVKKFIASTLLGVSTVSLLAACGSGDKKSSQEASGEIDKSETLTLDVYDELANYMGMQEGWFGKLVKDKFNIELNIIAPNVAGNGDTLYQTRTAAGDLGDIIITGAGKKYEELVEGGLLYDATDLYKDMDNVSKYDLAVEHLNEKVDGIYGFPTSVSSLPPTKPSEGLDLNYGAYIRWDLYNQIGYPDINTLEDLLPVLSEMQKINPKTDSGKKVYGFSLFGDWDGSMMGAGKQLAALSGYDELGFVLAKADGSDYQGILDDDSEYMRAIKLYFEANQLDLVDPESTTQNYDTLYSKFQDGQVLFSWWPWLGQTAYNTTEHLEEGKGFMLAPIKDQQIFSYGAEAYGANNAFIGIGASVESPERVAEFLDWLYSPEGASANTAQTQGSAGIQGLTWDMNDEGKPELTEFGKEAFLKGGATVPKEYGGGSYNDGVSALNVTTVLAIDKNPETGYPYNYTLWDTYQDSISNPLIDSWSEKMGGSKTTLDYLEKNNQILVAPGGSYIAPIDSSEIDTLRNQVSSTIVEYSWKMVFANNETEYNKLKSELQKTAKGLGYEDVLKVDMENAKEQNKAREAVVKEFKE